MIATLLLLSLLSLLLTLALYGLERWARRAWPEPQQQDAQVLDLRPALERRRRRRL